MTPVKALGKVIVELRELHGLDQGQLARAAKLSKAHLNKIEKGKQSTVGLEVLSRLAMVFGITSAALTVLIELQMQRSKKSR